MYLIGVQCSRRFIFGVSGGAPGAFFEGGGNVLAFEIFVYKAGVKAVATGCCVERGDFFCGTFVELSASRGQGGVAASCYYDDVIKFPAFFFDGLFERLVL